MHYSILDTPIEYLKGVGPQRGDILKKELQIFNYKDLLNLYPNRYLDRTKYYKINVKKYTIFYVVKDNIMEIRRIYYSQRNFEKLM